MKILDFCPNCHSQTPTFTGRNIAGRVYVQPTKCSICGGSVTENKYEKCGKCYQLNKPKRAAITMDEEIINLVGDVGLRKAASTLGITHTTLRKRLAKQNFFSPKRNQYKKYQ
jgi:hypothetical protein